MVGDVRIGKRLGVGRELGGYWGRLRMRFGGFGVLVIKLKRSELFVLYLYRKDLNVCDGFVIRNIFIVLVY